MTKREIVDHFDLDLKNCPMCGAGAAHDAGEAWAGGVFLREESRPAMWDGIFPAMLLYTVHCGRCDLQITRGTLEAAADAWNRRVKFAKLTDEEREYFEEQEAVDRYVMGEVE